MCGCGCGCCTRPAAKRSLTQTYRKFLTIRSRNRDESVQGEEMTALHVGPVANDDDEQVRARARRRRRCREAHARRRGPRRAAARQDAHEIGDAPDALPARKVGDVDGVRTWLGEEEDDDEDEADRLGTDPAPGRRGPPPAR